MILIIGAMVLASSMLMLIGWGLYELWKIEKFGFMIFLTAVVGSILMFIGIVLNK